MTGSPAGVQMAVYESWIDRQVREAIERGEFDNLRGAGKPLPGINGREDPDWWIKQKLADEDLSAALPTVLSLRKEVERLPEILADIRREDFVREIVEDLNSRIRESISRRVDGPLIPIRTVDVDAAVAAWRERRAD